MWLLSRAGRVEGCLICRVVPTRSFASAWAKGELMWYQVVWADGRREHPGEDHGPGWTVVAGLEAGRFVGDDLRALTYDAQRVLGPERDRLWRAYGPAA